MNRKLLFSSQWDIGTKNLPLDLLRTRTINLHSSASVLHLPSKERKKVKNGIAITILECENVRTLFLTLPSSLFTPTELSEQYARLISMML